MTTEEREALIAQGWTPPVAVDPDLAETYQFLGWEDEQGAILAALKHGREIERAEAKPGMVWVKYNGSGKCPVALSASVICRYVSSATQTLALDEARHQDWPNVTHYAIITPPEDK